MQKKEANGFHFLPRPSTITYMGPPCTCPELSGPRYMIDSEQVKNFVAIPTMALSHIQKIAPGPPTVIAMATPEMFPMPIVAARALTSAWKWVMSPGSSGSSNFPLIMSMACLKYRNGMKRE